MLVSACGKDVIDENIDKYAVLIDIDSDTLHLSKRIILIDRINFFNKAYYQVTPNVYYKNSPNILHRNKIKTYKIHKSRLIVFKDITTANFFLEKTSEYSNAHITSPQKPIIVREYPSIHKKKLFIIPKNTEAIVISAIVDKYTKYFDDTFSDSLVKKEAIENVSIEGTWVRIQYNLKRREFVRGWVLIDESMLYVRGNLSESMTAFQNTIAQSKIWKDEESSLNTLQVSFTQKGQSTQVDTVYLTQNDSSYAIAHGQLWPISKKEIFNPINNITFQALPHENKILVSTIYKETPYTYVASDTMSKKPSVPQASKNTDTTDIYNTLLFGLSTNTKFIEWTSSLYGFLYVAQNISTDASFKINIDWNITKEIGDIYFPKGVKTLRGILEFSNIFSDYVQQDTDGIMKFTVINTEQIIFLSYKIVDDATIVLQFIPEAGINYNENDGVYINAPPVLPKMIFKKKL